MAQWPSAREPDLRSACHGFESQPLRCRVQPWARCLLTCASVTKQYKSGTSQWAVMLSGSGVTMGLAENNGSLLQHLWIWSPHLRADCQGADSHLEPYAHFEYETIFTSLTILSLIIQIIFLFRYETVLQLTPSKKHLKIYLHICIEQAFSLLATAHTADLRHYRPLVHIKLKYWLVDWIHTESMLFLIFQLLCVLLRLQLFIQRPCFNHLFWCFCSHIFTN